MKKSASRWYLLAEKLYIFLIVYLTGSSSASIRKGTIFNVGMETF